MYVCMYARNYKPKSQSVDGMGCLIQNSLGVPELCRKLVTCPPSVIVSFYLSTCCPIIPWFCHSYSCLFFEALISLLSYPSIQVILATYFLIPPLIASILHSFPKLHPFEAFQFQFYSILDSIPFRFPSQPIPWHASSTQYHV